MSDQTGDRRTRKPDNMLYATDDRPPPGMLVALASQLVLVLSIFLVTPVTLARAANLNPQQAMTMLSLTLAGLGVASLLQLQRNFGSGLLVIPSAQSTYLPGCLVAVRLGGMPMVAGLLLCSSLLEMAMSRFLVRLRGLLPTELSGLIVLVTGLSIAQTGMDEIVGSMAAQQGAAWLPSLLVATLTLATMVGCSVWLRGPLRTLGAVIGLLGGSVAGALTGLAEAGSLRLLGHASWFSLPVLAPSWPSVSSGIVLPGLLSSLAITLNSIGALTAAQRLNDANWKRQDLNGLARGLLADGLGSFLAALIGGGPIAASASAVGLTANARASSRVIGYAAAAGFLLLSLVPKFALLILSVPRPVVGAALIYLSCSLLVSGIAIISSRLLDARKTFTLGIAFAFAAATPALTRVGSIVPDWMAPVLGSPLLASALVAICLNPILRLGIRQTVALPIPADGLPHETVAAFITRAGAAWGARRDVIGQLQGPVAECLDTLVDAGLAAEGAMLTIGFNDLQLDAALSWRGKPIPLSATRPSKAEFLESDDASLRMAGYLINRLASRVSSTATNGTALLHLVFDH